MFSVLEGGGKPRSPQAAFLLDMTESYHNLSIIFRKIGFPFSFENNVKFVAEFKLSNLRVGLNGCQREHLFLHLWGDY